MIGSEDEMLAKIAENSDLRDAAGRAPALRPSPTADELLAHVAHEMRNPLNALLAYTELLRSERLGAHSNPRYKQYSEVAHDAAESLLRICERLLAGHGAPAAAANARTENPREIVTAAVRRYEAMASERGVALEVQFDANFPALDIDPTVLEDALGNLISNAIKFTPKGGTVGVLGKVDKSTGAVIMVVRDTGTGITPQKLAEVLRFLPVKPTEGPHGDTGSGLGLSILKQQLSPFGVSIEVRSNPNFGTSVTLTFPTARPSGGD